MHCESEVGPPHDPDVRTEQKKMLRHRRIQRNLLGIRWNHKRPVKPTRAAFDAEVVAKPRRRIALPAEQVDGLNPAPRAWIEVRILRAAVEIPALPILRHFRFRSRGDHLDRKSTRLNSSH